MNDKLCVSERRIKILQILLLNKKTTRQKLSDEFQVSINTIVRDIEFISRIATIYTKQGNGGGIYILYVSLILSRICQKIKLTNSVFAFYGAKNVRMSDIRRSGDCSLEKLHL